MSAYSSLKKKTNKYIYNNFDRTNKYNLYFIRIRFLSGFAETFGFSITHLAENVLFFPKKKKN